MTKAKITPKSIDAYIKSFPTPTQKKLKEVRQIIKTIAPTVQEKISYQMPGFYLNGMLVWFAGYAQHIGFYPGASGIAAFADKFKLAKYKYAKGSVQFPLDKPLPLALIKKIVRFRVQENMSLHVPTQKILTKHPQGKSGKNISKQNYDAVKQAILLVLGKKELTHTELFEQVNKKLRGKFIGNIGWYAETVKLDLEARKIIQRVGKAPVRYRVR